MFCNLSVMHDCQHHSFRHGPLQRPVRLLSCPRFCIILSKIVKNVCFSSSVIPFSSSRLKSRDLLFDQIVMLDRFLRQQDPFQSGILRGCHPDDIALLFQILEHYRCRGSADSEFLLHILLIYIAVPALVIQISQQRPLHSVDFISFHLSKDRIDLPGGSCCWRP